MYLDPEHGTNSARTLIAAQLGAATLGFLAFRLLGPGYLAGSAAMLVLIVAMIVFAEVHGLESWHSPSVARATAAWHCPKRQRRGVTWSGVTSGRDLHALPAARYSEAEVSRHPPVTPPA
ncbi:MAG: hypothetical protein ABIS17_02620 [Casimicrobiaceae bacterium]